MRLKKCKGDSQYARRKRAGAKGSEVRLKKCDSIYSPSYFRDEGFFRASKIREDRKVTHTGNNIEMKPATYAANTETTPEPSRTLSPISEWKQGNAESRIGGEAFGAMPDFAPQDSLRGLASVDVQKDFPELEYVSPADRHTIEITEDTQKKEEMEAESPKSSPLVGILAIVCVTSVVYLGASTLSS